MIYLDHPATSWPKPACVIEAMKDFLERAGGNPGRSGHRLSIDAGRIVYDARERLAEFFGAPQANSVIFAHNATHALNIVIQTVLRPGDTVLTTAIEHNSVMRPLRAAEAAGVVVLTAPCDPTGRPDLDAFRRLAGQDIRLAIMTHASNVIGRIMPVAELSEIARRNGAMVLIDAAQTAGILPVNSQETGADFIAFTGHKALHGPPGTGGLVLCSDRASEEIGPLIRGGTGSRSISEEHPDVLPDRLEAGTPNGPGIAGLGAAVKWIVGQGPGRTREHHTKLTQGLLEGLGGIPGVELFGPPAGTERAPLISFRIRRLTVSDVGMRLDDEFGIMCRVGLHCAPAAHRTMGTLPEGTIRFGIGPFTTEDDIAQAVEAVMEVARDG